MPAFGIAAALVGTFVGVLLSYGFVGPLASRLRRRHREVPKALQCVKVKPSFSELEGHVRQRKAR